MAVKLLAQLGDDWLLVKVLLHAEIVPGVVAPMKLEGIDTKLIDDNDVWVTNVSVCPIDVSDFWMTKSSLMFVPVSVIVFAIGPRPGPETVTVIVPEVSIGNA